MVFIVGALAAALAFVFSGCAWAADPSPGASTYKSTPDSKDMGFRFDETSTVRGSGEVSIKSSFLDSTVDSSNWMKGSGSISFESLRNMSKVRQDVEFVQKGDLVFAGGQLKNRKSMHLPFFENGTGATVSERFNLSHVDKSEIDVIRSINRTNNSMVYDTALAFDGKWDIENRRGWSIYMDRSKESYTGSFQTQKKIEFDDSNLKQDSTRT